MPEAALPSVFHESLSRRARRRFRILDIQYVGVYPAQSRAVSTKVTATTPTTAIATIKEDGIILRRSKVVSAFDLC